MPIVSTGQITIVDHNDVTISTVQPVSPNVDQLWLDSSVVPNQMKRWNGATWVDTGVTPDYVAARGEGLLTNGTGLLGNNFNFPGFTFDASEAYGCAGSFTTKLYSSSTTRELMPCNSDDIYRLTQLLVWRPQGLLSNRRYTLTTTIPIHNNNNKINEVVRKKYHNVRNVRRLE